MNNQKEDEFEPAGEFCEKLGWQKQLSEGHTWKARMNSQELKKFSYAPFWARHPWMLLTGFVVACVFSAPLLTALTVTIITKINTPSVEKPTPVAQATPRTQASQMQQSVPTKPTVDLGALVRGAAAGDLRAASEEASVKASDLLGFAAAAVTGSQVSNFAPMPASGEQWPGDSVVHKCSPDRSVCFMGLLLKASESQKVLLVAVKKSDPSTLFNVLPDASDPRVSVTLPGLRVVYESQIRNYLNQAF